MNNKIIKNLINIILIIITSVYVFELLKIVLFKYGLVFDMRNIQIIPFADIFDFIKNKGNVTVLLKNILGNIAIFIPMGLLFCIFKKHATLKLTVLIGFIISLFFELIQLIVGCGITDINDLMLNTFGVYIGFLLYMILKKQKINIKISSIIFLVVFGMLGLLSIWLFNPSLLAQQIEYKNEELLSGFDNNSNDWSATGLDIDDQIYFEEGSVYKNSQDYPNVDIESCKLSNDVKVIKKIMSYKMSPNGNIQKTMVTYEESSKEELKNVLLKNKLFVDIWINENSECFMVVYINRN